MATLATVLVGVKSHHMRKAKPTAKSTAHATRVMLQSHVGCLRLREKSGCAGSVGAAVSNDRNVHAFILLPYAVSRMYMSSGTPVGLLCGSPAVVSNTRAHTWHTSGMCTFGSSIKNWNFQVGTHATFLETETAKKSRSYLASPTLIWNSTAGGPVAPFRLCTGLGPPA